MTVNLHHVKMEGHVWMESTHSHVDVELDLLVHIVKQVSIYSQGWPLNDK